MGAGLFVLATIGIVGIIGAIITHMSLRYLKDQRESEASTLRQHELEDMIERAVLSAMIPVQERLEALEEQKKLPSSLQKDRESR